MASEVFQGRFAIIDGEFSLDTPKVIHIGPRHLWKDGCVKSVYVLDGEEIYPGKFRKSKILGTYPEDHYMAIRDQVAQMFQPHITPREHQAFLNTTERFEIFTHTVRLEDKPRKKKVLGDYGEYDGLHTALAWTRCSWFGQNDIGGIVIIFTKEKVDEEIEKYRKQQKTKQWLRKNIIDITIAHELVHHIIRVLRKETNTRGHSALEAIIEDCAQAVIGNKELPIPEVERFLDDARIFGIIKTNP